MRVLIADTSRLNVRIMEKMLEGSGVRFDSASDGAEAMRLVLKYDYSIAFISDKLNDISGSELMRRMRDTLLARSLHEPEFVAMSMNPNGMIERRYLDAGFDGYLHKPFLKNRLWDVIDTVMTEAYGHEWRETAGLTAEDVSVLANNMVEAENEKNENIA